MSTTSGATPLTAGAPSTSGRHSTLEAFNVRRTESIDAPEIMKLIEKSTEKIFGKVNVVNIIEKAVLSITLTSTTGEVLGFGAFYDYPSGTVYDQKTWTDSLPGKFELTGITPLNTLFLHYFVSKRPYQQDIAREILRTVYNACVYVQHILLCSKSTGNLGTALMENFGRIKEGPKEERLFQCRRHVHVPQLHIREARPEDSDDLTPLFTQHNQVLTETYGDYFLAELIEAQDDKHKALVAEVGGLAIGFMCISTEVDTAMLNQCFELKSYNYLHGKASDGDASSVGSDSDAEEEEEEEEILIIEPEQTEVSISESVDRNIASPASSKGALEAVQSKQSVAESRSISIPPSHISEPASDAEKITKSDKSLVAAVEPEEPVQEEEEVSLGEPSAFCIQLFCIDERYEMRSIDFMVEAFRKFADKDYCVLTIPHTTPEFPLLQVFTRCTPRPTSTLQQELYLYHRSALLQNINVRYAVPADEEGITYISRKVKGKSTLMTDFHQYLLARRDEDGTPLHCIVAQCCGQIVGVAIIRAEMNTEYMRSHYNMEDFIYYTQHSPREHGHLHHCALSATFTHYTKLFLRECLRLCEMSCLYYNVYPKDQKSNIKPQSTVEALHQLVQIRPRRQIQYPVDRLKGYSPATYNNIPVDDVLNTLPPYALFHINRKLTLEPKMMINSRVVVVGASDVSLAFLETLALCPHIHFNNLVLVSPEGIPDKAPEALAQSLCSTTDYMSRISLTTSVNIVKGKMKSIIREDQYIVVDEGRKIHYDYLVLATGQQFVNSLPADSAPKSLSVSSPVQRDIEAVSNTGTTQVPAQVKTLDSIEAAGGVVEWAKSMGEGKLVVYGSTLTAYTTVEALLAGGVAGSQLIMVQPPTPISCFNNNSVLTIVHKAMSEQGVTLLSDLTLHQLQTAEDKLTGVEFAPIKGNIETVECCAMINLNEEAIDKNTFQGINNSCLVFDGRLVIDSNCQTNDPVIYAAGPLTKYKRALYSDDWTHNIYCSREVGERLATIMLPLFDPSFPPPPALEKYEIPKFCYPKKVYAKLPGGYHYLHVSKPQPLVDLSTLMMDPSYGREMITGDGDTGYFRLHINQYHTVETITCLNKEAIDIDNLCQLNGLHQEFMNSLEKRFDGGLIPDFYSYFKEPWCLALYHDRFTELRHEIRELLSHSTEPGQESLSEKVCQLVDEDLAIEEKTRLSLHKEYLDSVARDAVESRLFSFLSYNKYHLPHYAGRNMV